PGADDRQSTSATNSGHRWRHTEASYWDRSTVSSRKPRQPSEWPPQSGGHSAIPLVPPGLRVFPAPVSLCLSASPCRLKVYLLRLVRLEAGTATPSCCMIS